MIALPIYPIDLLNRSAQVDIEYTFKLWSHTLVKGFIMGSKKVSNSAAIGFNRQCAAPRRHTLALLASKPYRFSDAIFYPLLCSGADGDIPASSHIATDRFVEIARLVAANDRYAAIII